MVKIRSVLIAIASGLFVLAALFLGPWRWLHLNTLFDDWIFARDYIRTGTPALGQRLDKIAGEMIVAARSADADELLVVGHSLGAVLAIDLLDRALKLDPTFGAIGTPVTLLSIGSSILKIGLHGGAARFRAAAERVARAPGIFWGDYQSRIDIMNFYNTDPMAEMSLTTKHGPVVRFIEFSRALEGRVYRRIRLRFYRLHCQFISGNDKRDFYDYFMLVCGPISAKSQTLASEGALSMIGEDGMLLGTDVSREPMGEPAPPVDPR
jgi:pimeloyl-ACP methyl ester carboxylesterase